MDPATGKLTPQARRGVFVVWFVIFLDLLGFGIILPSLAYYVGIFHVPGWATEFSAGFGVTDPQAVFVGLIQTVFSLCQFVFAPLWGRLSDRVGRKPVLMASMAGFALAWLMFAFAPSLIFLLLARALAGVFAANLSTAQAYMADVFPPERRAKGMGLIGMAFGMGFVLGPAIGAVLVSGPVLGLFFEPGTPGYARGHLLVPALFAAALSLAALGLAALKLSESLPVEARANPRQRKGQVAELLEALRKPAIGPMLVVYFVATAGFANLEAMFSQFNKDHLGLPQSTNMWVFTCIGVTIALVQGGLIGRLTKALGSPRLLLLGQLGLALAMIWFGFQMEWSLGINATLLVILVSVLIGAFSAVSNPSLLTIISTHASRSTQGGTMGFTASSATLGRIVGPLMGGVIYAKWGPQWPFVAGAALIFLGTLVVLARWRQVASVPNSDSEH
ncbi:MAG: tetracycline resistance MFS efflux pump [Planctomycetota bacterium]|nr:MAG: tetracycline resistance MFS efflux pump [Planctomycetota bacterium]